MVNRGWLPVVALALVLGGGAFLRLWNLGATQFSHDELMMYYAGQSLARGEGPLLPTGELYERGIDVSRLIGVVDRVVERPELAARLPSALFGVASLLLMAGIAWSMAGPWAAVWSVLLLAIYPEALGQSRYVRFYTYQLCFGLVALYAGWRVVEAAATREAPDGRDPPRVWGWLALTLLAFALAVRVQVVSLSAGLGFGVAAALFAGLGVAYRGWGAWRGNALLLLTGAGVVGTAVFLLAFPTTVSRMLTLVFELPAWTGGTSGSPLAYYYVLSDAFPVLIALSPLVFLAAGLHNPRLGVYLFCWFAVPVAVHSLVFPWKAERFILLAVPALLLAGGIAAALGSRALYRALSGRLPLAEAPRRRVAGAMVGVVALAVVVTTPAFDAARAVVSAPAAGAGEDWRAAGEIVREEARGGAVAVGTTDPLAALFYWGRADFNVVASRLVENAFERRRVPGAARFAPAVLPTPEAIRARYPDAETILVAVDSTRWVAGRLDGALSRALREEGEEICGGRCGSVMLFRLRARTGGGEARRALTAGEGPPPVRVAGR